MDTSEVSVLLFGDQTVEKVTGVRALAQQAQTTEAAARFLRAAADAIKSELRELPADERADVEDFDTIVGLAEANAARGEPNETIATALMAVVRLGELIVFAEEDAAAVLGQGVEVIGLCTGQLPAAAAVAARDTSALFALAVETTRIAFRLGRDICRNSHRIDPQPGTWATTVVGLDLAHVQRILDDFHASARVPPARRIAVGVEAHGWLTLFGPPSTQTRLWECRPELAQASRIPTEARGGVHLPTVPPVDADWVLGRSPLLDTPLVPGKARMHSTFDAHPLAASTFGGLLRAVLPDIVHRPLRFGDTLNAAVNALPPGRAVRLFVLGPTGHTPFVERALASRAAEITLATHVVSPTLSAGSGAVAVVGMSGRFPGAGAGTDGVEGFWEVLEEGQRCVSEIPSSRFDLSTYFDSSLARHGSFLDRPGAFDNRLFSVSPREALQIDPVHRLLLTASYEALESAGYYPDATPATRSSRIATFLGQASDDHREILANEGVDIYYIPGIVRAFGPGRINYHFKFGAGAFSVDSACASSTTAITLACRALQNRDCDTALAGGGSVLSSPWPFAGLSRGGFLSLNGGCNTFHDSADGYCRGEAVGIVVLKRLEDALADNDNILGVITGAARNYSSDAASITHPSAPAQQRLYHDILNENATDPSSVSYVEMHGTGTQAGDSVEMSSVLSTFGRDRTKDNPLVVGAVKANIGHGEAAAGVSSLIKVLLMLRERRIPPQPNAPFKINESFADLARLNVRIATDTLPLRPAADGKRRVFLNSFDAAGGNSCLLLEEAPPKPRKTLDPRRCHVVALSGRTPASLSGNKQRLLEYLKQHPAVRLADVSYTTTARRMHGPLRSAFAVQNTAELVDRLEADLARNVEASKSRGPSANVVFSFTGQGSLYAGMGKSLWQHSLSFQKELKSFQALADAQGLPAFTHLISQKDFDVSTSSPAQCQLAIVALEIALARLWRSLGVEPDAVIGHSLGEYAALCVAGVLSVSDTLYLVATRAAMMEEKLEAHEYAMLAVSETESAVRKRLETGRWNSCEIACVNAPNMTVVSGKIDDVEALQGQLKSGGGRSTLLRVPYGFHSKQLEPILNDFEECSQGVVFSKPDVPIASTLLGTVLTDPKPFSPKYLRRQARETVSFVSAAEALKNAGMVNDNTMFVEMGPDPVCLGLIRSTLSVPQNRLVASLKSKDDDWTIISSGLAALYTAGVSIKWPEYHTDFVKHLSLLDLPRYAFDEKEFWVPFRQKTIASATNPASELPPAVPGFPTASLQRVKSTDSTAGSLSIVFESDPYEPSLLQAIRGHSVAGINICPSSVFCDMALSAAAYAHGVLQSDKPCPSLTISNLVISHPLVVSDKIRQQQIEVLVEVLDRNKTASCNVKYQLRDETGAHDLGGCSISYGGTDASKREISRALFFVRTRIEALREKASRGQGHRLFKPVVYKLFQNLVDYGPIYQGLEEVVLDNDLRDAVASVKLPAVSSKGNFMFKPHLLDAVVHLAGLLANCGLKYPEDTAFLSTGMEKWHFFEPLSENNTYTSYVHMEETQGGALLVGDIYVFHGESLACVALGVKSQKLKKSTLLALFQAADPGAQPSSKSGSSGVVPARDARSSHVADYPSAESTSQEAAESSESGESATPATSVSEDDATACSETVDKLLTAVAVETGADTVEMTSDAVFADLGVDSLMAIAIIAAVRNQTGVELPGSFFLDHRTVGEATAALVGGEAPAEGGIEDEEDVVDGDDHDKALSESEEQDSHRLTESATSLPETVKESPPPSTPVQLQAKAILMQGSPSSTEAPIFLLADATGTVSSYTTLPAISRGRMVYGIESPFAREGPDYKVSVEILASVYVDTIRKTHAAGPYILGGFSVGAVHAFECCRLLAPGSVLGLVLIDMPVPAAGGVDPEGLIAPDALKSAGMFLSGGGSGSATGRRLPSRLAADKAQKEEHACATVRSLLGYRPSPLPVAARPRRGTVLIAGSSFRNPIGGEGGRAGGDEWEDALMRRACGRWDDDDDDDDVDKSKGWKGLVGDEVVRYDVEAGHMEMLRYPKVKDVAKAYKEAVEKILGQ